MGDARSWLVFLIGALLIVVIGIALVAGLVAGILVFLKRSSRR